MRGILPGIFVAVTLATLACSSSNPTTADSLTVDAPASEARDGDVVFIDTGIPKLDVVDLQVADVLDIADTQPLLCDPGEGCFLDKCSDNKVCQSGWCVQHLGEGVCSQACQEECPPGWTCSQVAGTDPDVVYICVSSYANLCRPCTINSDCSSIGGANDACIDYGHDGNFCGGLCGDDESCPWGFSCKEVLTVEGSSLQQCVNDTGECPCTGSSVALGLTTPCATDNDVGSCPGKRTCTVEGLSTCDAPEPAVEECDGMDSDCDDEVDEPDLVEGNYVNLCDDDNGCTEDKCMGEEGCVNEILDSGPCEDGDPCTVADHCLAGTCLGDPVECDDEDSCTDNVCTETGGCEYPPATGPCDDGNPCTLADQCSEGECGGTPVNCDCLKDADCGEKEDGNQCNGTLVCDTGALPFKCIVDLETIVACSDPDEEDAFCLQSSCDQGTGECSFTPNHEGFLCDNIDACTFNTKCVEGVCAGGSTVNCNDGNPCTDDSCDGAVGCVNAPNEAPCSDGDACTTEDGCLDGECAGGPAPACDDDNVCTTDTCAPGVGCIHEATAGNCDDGNACTATDSCVEGKCIGAGQVDCGDDNPCTDNICDPADGCVSTLNEALCNDGDICSTDDHCHLGDCIGAGELPCDDGNACTDDSCDPNIGCQFTVNNGACDDADPCTDADACALGACVGQAKECSDGNSCTEDSCNLTGECTFLALEEGTECGIGPQWKCVGGQCQCDPQCDGNECGDDGCGGSCGACPNEADFCVNGSCICLTDCVGKVCGDNGCGGSCGSCNIQNQICEVGKCICPGTPCAGKCCPGEQVCSPEQECCQPQCQDKVCGDNGCGGNCGDCGEGEACNNGACVDMTCDDGNDVDWDGCTNGQITEWQVNEMALFEQDEPTSLALGNGDLLLFWRTEFQSDGTAGGLMSKRIGLDGSIIEGEHAVDGCSDLRTFTMPDGSGLLLCSGEHVLFGTNGEQSPNPAPYNLPNNGKRDFWKSLVALPDGRFARAAGGDEIQAALISESGGVTEKWVQANTYTLGTQTNPAIGRLADGGFCVTWESEKQDGSSFGIFGVVLDSELNALTEEFQVNAWTDSYQNNSFVIPLAGGGFAVAWISHGADGDSKGVFLRIFDAAGQPLSDDFQVNESSDGDQGQETMYLPLSDGRFVISWIGTNGGNENEGALFRIFNANGTPSGGEHRANHGHFPQQIHHWLSVHHNDTIALVWQAYGQDGDEWGIFAQRFDKDGNKIYH
jgi:hypothetical protein